MSTFNLPKLVATYWLTNHIFGGAFATIFLITTYLYTRFWYITPLYLAYLYLDRDVHAKGGRPWNWARNFFLWRHFCAHFPIRLVRTVELHAGRNYLGAAFPHGVLPFGLWGATATNHCNFRQLFPHHEPKCAILALLFYFPFFRDYCLAHGGVSPSKRAILCALNGEKSVLMTIIVGGAEESFYCRPGSYKLVLRNRRGFVRIALETGTDLVPIFTFGENEVVEHVKSEGILNVAQNRCKKWFGFNPVILTSLVPRQVPLTVVVGKPISVEKEENPSTEKVNELHAAFIKSLIELFEENKKLYIEDYENVHLDII